MDLINHKRKRMCCITRLVVMNRTELPFAYSALTPHGFKACPVLPSKVAIPIPRVTCHVSFSCGWVFPSSGSPPFHSMPGRQLFIKEGFTAFKVLSKDNRLPGCKRKKTRSFWPSFTYAHSSTFCQQTVSISIQCLVLSGFQCIHLLIKDS